MVDRASRPAAALNSDQARVESIVLPPNSQPFPSENSLSNTTDVDGPESYTETPAGHVRNALQLLSHGQRFERDPIADIDARVLLEAVDVDAIVARLRQALAQLEGVTPPRFYQLTSRGAAAIAAFVGERPTCIHCGCTDTVACLLDVAYLTERDRHDVTAYYAETGQALPAKVTCWWISESPAVCSNPHCAELHRAATVGVTS